MGKVIASITTSVDGFITGPDDGPDCGLGKGGERLHHWVMGGPWTYDGGHEFAMHGPDKQFYDELVSTGTSKRGRHPWLGITSQELEGRVFVQKVQADSPAERAGLKSGDIVLAIGGEKISKLEQFYSVLWKDRRPGDDIVLTVLQGTDVQRITVKSIDRADYVRAKARI